MNKRLLALFPLTAVAAAVGIAVTGCGGSSSSTDTPVAPAAKSISFVEIAYPVSDADKRVVNASSSVTVDGETQAIGFNTILRSGEQRGTGVFGLLYDTNDNPLTETDGSLVISDDNDHSTLLDVHDKLFMMSQFESRPGAFYLTELNQDATTGKLTALSTKPVDFSAVGGGWVHCAGSRTPWKSHLGSEEYEPDARLVDPATGIKANADGSSPDTYYGAMGDYFGGDMTRVNPYMYGYITEAKVTSADMGTGTFASNVSVAKHYVMGRLAFELAYVMPDNKTAYMTDDGKMVGFFKFVADTAEDLSAGTLYAAKLTQTTEVSADLGGSFTIDWIKLGHATNAEIKAIIDGGITFADIFETEAVSGSACSAGFTGVSKGHKKTEGETYSECLKLKPGMEKAAAFLETRRYAAMLGATTELNKEEGVTFDPTSKKMYLAMSEVEQGMEDGHSNEVFNGNHVKVTKNKCGVVYELDVDTNYSATTMKGLVAGTPTTYDASSPYVGNTCDVNGLANPDNVTVMPGYDTLIIGEDTGSGHQNDLIWSFNLKTKALTRIQTTPYGSETTSPYFYPNINGFGYLMSVIQHPYGESDKTEVFDGSAERRAYTGYVGPFPAMD
ncbi:MAG: alkaline phosphatase PhoX [Pseudomonadota bacterium]